MKITQNLNRRTDGFKLRFMNKLGEIMVYTNEKLISKLQRFYNETDRVPTAKDMQKKFGYPSVKTFQNYFDSWNNALITAGFEINKRNDRLDGTETCSYCGKRADEIPNFGAWRYTNGIRYCMKHGNNGKGIPPEYVIGNLDINSSTGLGRLGEIIVVKTLKISNDFDCNRENCNYPIDMYHEKYGKIDVKTALLSDTTNIWLFLFDAKKIADTYICLGLSSNRSNVEHVWVIPNEGEIRNKQTFGVTNSYRGLANRDHWEVDDNPYDDTLQTLDLGNCKIMVDKKL